MPGLLKTGRTGPRRLRELPRGSGPVVAPGAYDAMSALPVEQAGFPAVYMTGFGAAASLLGRRSLLMPRIRSRAGGAPLMSRRPRSSASSRTSPRWRWWDEKSIS